DPWWGATLSSYYSPQASWAREQGRRLSEAVRGGALANVAASGALGALPMAAAWAWRGLQSVSGGGGGPEAAKPAVPTADPPTVAPHDARQQAAAQAAAAGARAAEAVKKAQ